MLDVPISSLAECLERPGRTDLVDDLDPDAERQLCRLAELEDGVAAVFESRVCRTEARLRPGASPFGDHLAFSLLMTVTVPFSSLLS